MSDPRSILESLDYGPAPESDEDARSWIARWGDAMPLFIDGAFETPAGRENSGWLRSRRMMLGFGVTLSSSRAYSHLRAPPWRSRKLCFQASKLAWS